MMEGRITFYNEKFGEGKVVTRQEKVYPFKMDAWIDFDALPSVGLLVDFTLDSKGQVSKLTSSKGAPEKKQEPPNKQETPNKQEPPKKQPLQPSAALPKVAESKPDTESAVPIRQNVKQCILHYFADIEQILRKHAQSLESAQELDFSRMRRFLFTAYHDLYELDNSLTDQEMDRLKGEMIFLQKEYDNFKRKINYPLKYAFDRIFLRQQPEFVRMEEALEFAKSKLTTYSLQERPIIDRIDHKERELKEIKNARSEQYQTLEKETKALRRRYVDLLHLIAKLKDEIAELSEKIHIYKEEHFRDFVAVYEPASRYLESRLNKLLNIKAYQFDTMLWSRAKNSRLIRQFFMDSGIEGTYSSRTFLKYYLRTLDKEKLSAQNKELFELLRYLDSLGTRSILIIKSNVESAMRCKYLIENFDKELKVHATYDALDTFQSCLKEKPDLIMLDYNLRTTNAFEYITKYRQICEQEGRETTFCLFVNDTETAILKEAKAMRIRHFIGSGVNDEEFLDKLRDIL